MWQEEAAKLVSEETEMLLSPLAATDNLYNLVKEALIKARRGLSFESKYPWTLVPLIVSDAILGHYEQAVPAAAAIQLFKAAAEVLDDIEDADSSDSLASRYGLAAATNTATTLIILAEKAITRLKGRGVADDTIVRIVDAVNSYYTTACAGQHLDLCIKPKTTISEETYLKITAMKSASQAECTFCIGALLADAQPQLISLFSKFGHNLGMAAQIANDIRGITRRADIMRRKMTLPVIYALAQTDGKVHTQLEAAFQRQSEVAPDPAHIRDLLFNIGAIHYSTLKMEFYKQNAIDALSEAEKTGTCVERLKLFLE
jgi:geranylgeranyl diphosphate synthase type I